MLLFSINSTAQSVEKIELINSDRLINGPKHTDYWICIGNVKFYHKNTIMQCDSSHHYTKQNKMIAFGNIKITKGDSLLIYGDKLVYNGNKNVANLRGNVLLRDKYTKLSTEKITYNLIKEIAYYPKKGTIIDDNITLTSERGVYNTKKHMFFFKENVKVISNNYSVETDTLNYNSENKTTYFIGPTFIFSENNIIYCENGWYNTQNDISQFKENAYISNSKRLVKGDSLYYDRNIGYGRAINNITMVDSSNNIIVNGNLAEYFENEDHIEVTKNALLNILFEKDTLFMTADKFVSYTSNKNHILAYKNVKIFKEDLQGKCDSLHYNISDSTVELFASPILWIDEMQITSDSINIQLKNNKINKMNFFPNSMIVSSVDSIYFNQIKGKYMYAYFKKNKLNKLNIKGNGESIFIIEDENDINKKIGLNKVKCSNIDIQIQENKISSIQYKIFPISTTIPNQNIKEEDKFLENFIWRIDEKPNSLKEILQ